MTSSHCDRCYEHRLLLLIFSGWLWSGVDLKSVGLHPQIQFVPMRRIPPPFSFFPRLHLPLARLRRDDQGCQQYQRGALELMFEPLSREKDFICGRLLSGTVVRRRCLSCLCETAADVMESFGKTTQTRKSTQAGHKWLALKMRLPDEIAAAEQEVHGEEN